MRRTRALIAVENNLRVSLDIGGSARISVELGARSGVEAAPTPCRSEDERGSWSGVVVVSMRWLKLRPGYCLGGGGCWLAAGAAFMYEGGLWATAAAFARICSSRVTRGCCGGGAGVRADTTVTPPPGESSPRTSTPLLEPSAARYWYDEEVPTPRSKSSALVTGGRHR